MEIFVVIAVVVLIIVVWSHFSSKAENQGDTAKKKSHNTGSQSSCVTSMQTHSVSDNRSQAIAPLVVRTSTQDSNRLHCDDSSSSSSSDSYSDSGCSDSGGGDCGCD